MNRVASLAAGIGGSSFEWNPHPAAKRSTPAVKSDSHSETNLTFSPTTNADQIAEPTSSMFKPGSEAQSDAAYYVADFHPSESDIQQIPDEVMYDEEDSSMSDVTNVRQEQEEESAPSFESMQTTAPGLPPLRLHPKSAPEKPRSGSKPYLRHLLLPTHDSRLSSTAGEDSTNMPMLHLSAAQQTLCAVGIKSIGEKHMTLAQCAAELLTPLHQQASLPVRLQLRGGPLQTRLTR